MNTLTISAPTGTTCTLFPNAPAAHNLNAIDPAGAIPPIELTTTDGITTCYYTGLPLGLYHCVAVLEGCCSMQPHLLSLIIRCGTRTRS